jgi:IrrE N-terminal-like domain
VIHTWGEAHRIAQIAAGHVHHDLGVARDAYVDVFSAIRQSDTPLRFELLPKLFGIYICPASDGPGILLNSGLSLTALRHTAAHELGHQRLGHGDAVDLVLDPWDGQAQSAGWSGPEMSAEAFAAWFLMPRPAVVRGLATLGIRRPQTAEDVYRLATLLGASFRGLCRHLVNLRLADAQEAHIWAKTGRGRLRQRLAGASADLCRGEVHLLQPEMGDVTIHAGADDLLVLPPGVSTQEIGPVPGLEKICSRGDLPHQLEIVDGAAGPSYWRVTSDLVAPVLMRPSAANGGARCWSICVQPIHVREGIDLAWLEAHQNYYPNEDAAPW